MTKLVEKTQFKDFETNIFKCWCGESSYLEVVKDIEDGDIYITITKYPTRLLERLKMAYMALRGIEFDSTNSVMIAQEDIPQLIKALKKAKK